MFFAPVIDRELRRALHANKTRKSRFRVAVIGICLSAFWLLVFGLSGWTGLGRTLHVWLCYMGLFLAVAPATRITVGLFSEERRNQTLELLFLTGMTSGELFVGKLLGGVLIASTDLLALAPLLALPFFMGGISLELFLATIACLPVVLLFVISAGALASVLFKDDGVASIFALAFIGSVSLAAPIPYYLGNVLAGTTPFSAKWLCLSPAYAPYLVLAGFGTAGPGTFWIALLAALAWTCLCLGLARFVLSRNWRNDVRATSRTGLRGRIDAWVHGAEPWRASLRKRELPENAYQWLVQQDRRPVLLGCGIIALICLLWLAGWRAWPRAWPSSANLVLTAVLLISAFNWLRLFAAARRLATDRRDGIFELLLTTPLSPEQIVDGGVAGLVALFRPLQIVVAGLLLLMMLGGSLMRPWNPRAALTYALVWAALCAWCLANPRGGILKVMWAALNTGRAVYSVSRTRRGKWEWAFVYLMFQGLLNGVVLGARGGFPSGSGVEFAFVCVVAAIVGVSWSLGITVRRELERETRRRMVWEMRIIATEPLPDPNDPAFKDWDNVQRLPHRITASQAAGWPLFVDPAGPPPARGRAALSPGGPPVGVPLHQDARDLLRLLRYREAGFAVVGELATNAWIGDRRVNDAELLMSATALASVPELQVRERTDFFRWAQFRPIQVIVYLTSNPLFETVALRPATTFRVGELDIPVVSVEGLIVLNLYALHLLSRQREFYRQERYELNIIALLARHPTPLEPVLALVGSYVPEQHLTDLEGTLQQCAQSAARMRRRTPDAVAH